MDGDTHLSLGERPTARCSMRLLALCVTVSAILTLVLNLQYHRSQEQDESRTRLAPSPVTKQYATAGTLTQTPTQQASALPSTLPPLPPDIVWSQPRQAGNTLFYAQDSRPLKRPAMLIESELLAADDRRHTSLSQYGDALTANGWQQTAGVDDVGDWWIRDSQFLSILHSRSTRSEPTSYRVYYTP